MCSTGPRPRRHWWRSTHVTWLGARSPRSGCRSACRTGSTRPGCPRSKPDMEFSYEGVLPGLRTAYDAKVAERDAHVVEPWKDAERARLLELLRAEQRTTLVDIGAGTGVHGAYFRDAGLDVTCVDCSPGRR